MGAGCSYRLFLLHLYVFRGIETDKKLLLEIYPFDIINRLVFKNHLAGKKWNKPTNQENSGNECKMSGVQLG